MDKTSDSIQTFDISNVKYDRNGIIDFYWPLDNKAATVVKDELTRQLLPFIIKNQNNY